MWCTVILIQLTRGRQAWKCICRGTQERCELERQRSDVHDVTMPGQLRPAQVIVMPADEWGRIVRQQKMLPHPFAL